MTRQRVGRFMSKVAGEMLWVDLDRYAGGPLAVSLTTKNESYCTLSVNMYKPECSQDSRDLPADVFYMKDWSGNEEIASEVIELGLVERVRDVPPAQSGFVIADAYKLNLEKLHAS